MAGWRVGLLCGKAERINEVLRFRSNMDSGMFLPLQLAAAKALTLGDDWYKQLNALYAKRRDKVFELLKLLKCTFQKEQAGLFVWAKVGSTSVSKPGTHELGSGGLLSDEILENANVFITPGGIFGDAGKPYVRVSLCASEEKIQEAINRVQAYKKNKA